MKAMLPFYGMGLLAVAMAVTTRGQPAISVQTLEKDQPTTERSQTSTPDTQHLTPNHQPLKADTKSPFKAKREKESASNLSGMSDAQILQKVSQDFGIQPPVLKYSCSDPDSPIKTFAGLYDPNNNTVKFCKKRSGDRDQQIFALVHELGHAKQHQSGGSSEPAEEFADKTAVNYLAEQGYWSAIKTRADSKTQYQQYEPGKQYAQRILKEKNQ